MPSAPFYVVPFQIMDHFWKWCAHLQVFLISSFGTAIIFFPNRILTMPLSLKCKFPSWFCFPFCVEDHARTRNLAASCGCHMVCVSARTRRLWRSTAASLVAIAVSNPILSLIQQITYNNSVFSMFFFCFFFLNMCLYSYITNRITNKLKQAKMEHNKLALISVLL